MRVKALGGIKPSMNAYELTFEDGYGVSHRILIDSGVDPSTKEPHLKPSGLVEGVILTHAHFDHIGNVPFTFYENQGAWLMASSPTIELARLNWLDTLNILDRENRGKDMIVAEFLYRFATGLKIANENRMVLKKGGTTEIYPEVFITCGSACHLPGAMWVAIEAGGKTVVFTGDWSFQDRPTVRGTNISELPKRIDAIFMDSTNGANDGPSLASEQGRLLRDLKADLSEGRTVVEATLSFGKLPDLAVLMAQNGIDSYVDGSGQDTLLTTIDPQCKWDHTVDVEYCIEEPKFRGDFRSVRIGDARIRLIDNDTQRRRLINMPGPKVINAPSGMLVGGRSVQYTKIFLADPEARVYLTSYQAEGTPGRELRQKIHTGGMITMKDARGRKFQVPIKALVRDYNMSGHAAGSESVNAIRVLKPKETFLMHAEGESKAQLIERLYNELGYENVYIPQLGDDIVI